MMKRLSILTCMVFFVLSSQQDASAQLLMEKSRVVETVAPGNVVVDDMVLHNTSNEAIDVKVYWEDFSYLPPFKGEKKYTPAGLGERSMSDWVSFSPQQFTLPAQGRADIDYSIRVPADAQGGYNGVLFFEQRSADLTKQTGVSVVMRVGSLFFIETTNSNKNARLDDFYFEQNRLLGYFYNEGDVTAFPKGVYYTLDQEGRVYNRGEVEQMYLPAGNKTTFSVNYKTSMPPGSYSCILTFELSNQDVVVKEINFTKMSDQTFIINSVNN